VNPLIYSPLFIPKVQDSQDTNMLNSEMAPKLLAREKVARSSLAVFVLAMVAGMMLLCPLTSIVSPSRRTSNNLFSRQLLFLKEDPVGSEEECAGGEECQDFCASDASCKTGACQDACQNIVSALGCGCSTAEDVCWNKDCEAQCSQDYICESE
jgi:hypothetical protein